jgi:hypothetical protein
MLHPIQTCLYSCKWATLTSLRRIHDYLLLCCTGEVLRPIAENVWAADRPFIWNRIDVGKPLHFLHLSSMSHA